MDWKDPIQVSEYNKKYRLKNKDKLIEYRKEYYSNNKDIYYKEYYHNNKDRIDKRNKEYYHNNKYKMCKYGKEYYRNNKDKVDKRNKEYYHNNKYKIAERSKKYRCNNKDKVDKRNKEYRCNNKDKIRLRLLQLKITVFSYYSNNNIQCACCGINEIECLTIDHINGNGSKHRKENNITSIYQWLINNNYPKGYQILCYNCNCAKRDKPKCPLKHLY